MNTKAIARLAGTTTARVNELMRDLRIEHYYNDTNHYWVITNRHEASMLISFAKKG